MLNFVLIIHFTYLQWVTAVLGSVVTKKKTQRASTEPNEVFNYINVSNVLEVILNDKFSDFTL